MKLGIDVGSTTVKLVLLNEQDEILYQKYERHMSSVFDKVRDLLIQMQQEMGEMDVQVVITGSGGLALADKIGAKFEQEVRIPGAADTRIRSWQTAWRRSSARCIWTAATKRCSSS